MKYLVREEGGFVGIPRDYKGEIPMSNKEARQLLSALKEGEKHAKREIIDALYYYIELQHRGKRYSAAYDEQSLPEEIRNFLELIRNKS